MHDLLSYKYMLLCYLSCYSWYCHVDDDIYLNAESLAKVLSKYGDPHTQHVYLGQWKVLEKFFYHAPRIKNVSNIAF